MAEKSTSTKATGAKAADKAKAAKKAKTSDESAFVQGSDVTSSEFSSSKLRALVPYEQDRAVTKALAGFLADSYVLYVKSHGYHWNVRGPYFSSLHALFETHYTDLATAIDEIAERIRALGENAPGSMAEFQKLSDLKEAAEVPTAEEMIRDLADDHQKMSHSSAALIEVAETAGDAVTADLATVRQSFHDKAAWMLRSHLG